MTWQWQILQAGAVSSARVAESDNRGLTPILGAGRRHTVGTDTAGRTPGGTIAVRGAAEHNLKSVDVDIPRGVIAVVTGVSGSGKSTLAFDTICAEGRRRYLETFSSYARQFLGRLARPAVARIDGLSPAVAVDQRSGVSNPRSTVGTMTELYDLLRLLWARLGAASPGVEMPRVERSLFSFNSPLGACPACRGLGVEDRLDPDLLVAHPERTIREGALRITTPNGYLVYSQVTLDVLDQVCRAHGFSVDVPWQALTADQRDVILNGSDRIRIPFGKHPLASRLRWSGITAKPREEGTYKGILPVMEQILARKRSPNILRFVRSLPCRACLGTRLRPEALAVTFRGRTIAHAAAMDLDSLAVFFEGLAFAAVDSAAGDTIRRHVLDRAGILRRLGLGYLTLDRDATTLSGGEAQRIRLARQAGIGLRGVLYVLDEPSIGLHHRDTGRLLEVLRLIRDRGNTVLVVEHDEQTIRHADWIVDVGPAAGAAGGEVLFSGPTSEFLAADATRHAPGLAASRTRAFLTGQERIAVPGRRRTGRGRLVVPGISRHNLHDVSVTFLLGAFNAVTGVSGSGKSTLVEETIRLLREARAAASPRNPADHPPVDAARVSVVLPGGAGTALATSIDKIIEIDQSPIGRTPRSNPATYTGLFDLVRGLFASEPEAVRRGFDKGRFSFNVRGGRCDGCEGAGVRQVGMHFLGPVAVVCDDCGGRRFNADTLAVRYRGRSIHDVLEMPIGEAGPFFADQPGIARAVGALGALGLGYLPLGHPATMLSGGEAQRVKLATELARPGTGRTLYLLDEPTTGLHAADIVLLLAAIDRLIDAGNTVIAVEHNLDVIKVADHVVDLGPESGAAGGLIIAAGTPEDVAASGRSFTGIALRDALTGVGGSPPSTDGTAPAAAPVPASARDAEPLHLTGVATHNLRHVDVTIPANVLTVITGVSGSGKSSLAFDTIFSEGQQRFADSFSTYARRFVQRADEAEFESVSGLTPTIAISQQAPSRNPRSTVGTLTEIHDHYRLLYARAGTRFCPRCSSPLGGSRCASCGFTGERVLTASMFSPNSEHGACARCHGLGQIIACDPDKLVTDPLRPIAGGAMAGHKTGRFYGDPRGQHMAILAAAGRALGIDFGVPWTSLDGGARSIALRGAGDRSFDVEWAYERGARRGVHAFASTWPGLLEYVRREYERKHGDARGEALEPLMTPVPCEACGGGKLGPEFLAVRFGGTAIHELLAKTVEESLAFFHALDNGRSDVPARDATVSRELRADITGRLQSLADAGLDYLTLDRPAASLSGGEAQRVRLATQLRSGLTSITYVLDEPTAGLHPRDTERLVELLRSLRDAGNSVIVVEHDADVIAAADYLIEIGPGPGAAGGRIVAQGRPGEVRQPRDHEAPAGIAPAQAASRRGLRPGVSVRGASVHNLASIDAEFPAGGLVAVTGVSGSGKSSLVFDVLAPSVERAIEAGAIAAAPVNCRAASVHEAFHGVVREGRAGAGWSPWSHVATAAGLFDEVRDRFAQSDSARARGFRASHFSTQGQGGRCVSCEGIGQVRISMDFLPDVWTRCEDCGGKRYTRDVLACTIGNRTIADVLDMSVDAARVFFAGPGANGCARRADDSGAGTPPPSGLSPGRTRRAARRRPRVHHPRPARAHVVGRRAPAARPLPGPARSWRRPEALSSRRADDRPPCQRREAVDRRVRSPDRRRSHDRGRRAQPRHHATRGLADRSRPGGRQSRRAPGRERAAGSDRRRGGIAHGPCVEAREEAGAGSRESVSAAADGRSRPERVALRSPGIRFPRPATGPALLFRALVADGQPAGRDSRLDIRQARDVGVEIAGHPVPPPPGIHVVRREAAADPEFRDDGFRVVRVPVLVGVDEHEIERALDAGHEIVRVAEARVDVGRDARVLEVAQGLAVTPVVDLDRGELSAGPGQGPRRPDRRAPGGGADLQRALVAVLQHQVVKLAAVRLRHVQVVPVGAVLVEEPRHAGVEIGLPAGGWLRAGEHRAGEQDHADGLHRGSDHAALPIPAPAGRPRTSHRPMYPRYDDRRRVFTAPQGARRPGVARREPRW